MDELLGQRLSEPKSTRFGCVVLTTGFFLALLPLAWNYIAHYPDERHYTDGALQMLSDGQWLSPRQADGSYRFRKPILAYWAAAGGIALFGCNPLGARIVFLLAVTGMVYLTYRIALLIYRDRGSALLAGAIIATDIVVVLSATRSMPDGIFGFFVTLSILGFTGILLDQGSKRHWYWMAYLGVGLALASKGGLALLVVAYFFVVALAVYGRHGPRLLLHTPSIITGLILGFGWYVAVLVMHGSDMWTPFWGDQMGNRLTQNWFRTFRNLSRYIPLYLLQFLPWLFCLPQLLRHRRLFCPRSARHRLADRMIWGWLAVTTVVSSLGITLHDRYTLYAAPLGAVLLAGLFHRAEPHKLRCQLDGGIKAAVAVLILAGGVVALVNLSLGQKVLAVAVLAGGVILGWTLLTAARNERWISRPIAISLALLGLVPTICLGLGHLVLPDQAEQIAQTLQRDQLLRGQSNYQPIVMIGKPALAAKIRLFTCGHAVLRGYTTVDVPGARQAAGSAEWILANKGILDTLDLPGYRYTEASQGLFADISVWNICQAVCQGTITEFVHSRRTAMILAQRQSVFSQPEPPP